MSQRKGQVLGTLSGIFHILAFSQLILNVYITKNTSNLTFTWIYLVLIAQTLIVIYGFLNNAYEIYIPELILTIGIFYILFIKIKYKDNENIEMELKEKNIL